jgi:hypothetical protein
MRLRDYVETHNLKVTNLRLEAYGRRVHLIPYKDAEGQAQLNGYWQSKQINAVLSSGGVIESNARGVGILKGREIWITWVYQDGTTKQEVREYEFGDKAVIVNNVP